MNGETGDTGFDLDASMDAVAASMSDSGTETQDVEAVATEQATAQPAEQAPVVRSAPKAWAKEQHEHWSRLDPKVQDYIELREKQMLEGLDMYKGDAGYAKQLKEVLTPYLPHLKAHGVSDIEAVSYLLNAHFGLTNGPEEQRRNLYRQLGVDLGLVQAEAEGVVDPALKTLQQKVNALESQRQSEARAAQQAARQKADSEINAFASDPANVHFKEVAADMLPFVNAGLTLKDAYDKAVWANPVTRQKELSRQQTEAEAKLKEKARAEAEAAQRAAGTNLRGAKTQQAPTEPQGSMEDTMRDTLRKIRARA